MLGESDEMMADLLVVLFRLRLVSFKEFLGSLEVLGVVFSRFFSSCSGFEWGLLEVFKGFSKNFLVVFAWACGLDFHPVSRGFS